LNAVNLSTKLKGGGMAELVVPQPMVPEVKGLHLHNYQQQMLFHILLWLAMHANVLFELYMKVCTNDCRQILWVQYTVNIHSIQHLEVCWHVG
jgi:hypothetical protein